MFLVMRVMQSGWFFACYVVYIIKLTRQKYKILSIKVLSRLQSYKYLIYCKL